MTEPVTPNEPRRSAVPTKAELEHEQAYLAVQKAKIELRKLEQEAKPEPWWLKLAKNVVAIGGIVTVAATAYGLWDSYNKTIDDRNKTRIERERTRVTEERTRFEDAIKRLESPSTISKLVGVSVLSGYLTADSSTPANRDLHRQIFFTLAGLMATEQDYQTQIAVTDLISAIPENGRIDKRDWVYFQEMLISQSRALVGKGDLFNRRHTQAGATLTNEEKAARTIGKLIGICARRGAIPTDLKFRDIYCAECDFHGVTFPPQIDFSGAILDRANFNRAILNDAIFDNAELLGTTFVEADLPGAMFRSLEPVAPITDEPRENQSFPGRTQYLDHAVGELENSALISIKMPNFSCANLENAIFDGHALFPAVLGFRREYAKTQAIKPRWFDTMPLYLLDVLANRSTIRFSPALVTPPKFFKANLKNAKLDKVRYFVIIGADDELEDYMSSFQSVAGKGIKVGIGDVSEEAFQTAKELKEQPKSGRDDERMRERTYSLITFQRRLRASFFDATVDAAALRPDISDFLKKQIPSRGDYSAIFRRIGAHGDADSDCTTKRK